MLIDALRIAPFENNGHFMLIDALEKLISFARLDKIHEFSHRIAPKHNKLSVAGLPTHQGVRQNLSEFSLLKKSFPSTSYDVIIVKSFV